VSAVAIVASLGLIVYQLWAIRSDAAAEKLFLASESCALTSADSAKPAPTGACRREFATVIKRRIVHSRWGEYWLTTMAGDGREEATQLTSYNAADFLQRVQVNERIALVRFIAPGYALTGRIAAFGDALGIVGTYYHPSSRARARGFLAIVGILICAFASLWYYAAAKAARQWPYSAAVAPDTQL
jgi:hypothetical protein